MNFFSSCFRLTKIISACGLCDLFADKCLGLARDPRSDELADK